MFTLETSQSLPVTIKIIVIPVCYLQKSSDMGVGLMKRKIIHNFWDWNSYITQPKISLKFDGQLIYWVTDALQYFTRKYLFFFVIFCGQVRSSLACSNCIISLMLRFSTLQGHILIIKMIFAYGKEVEYIRNDLTLIKHISFW